MISLRIYDIRSYCNKIYKRKKEDNNMLDKEEYKCVKYNSRLKCQTCDDFGRNLDRKVNIENCYNTKRNILNILEILYNLQRDKK